MGGPRAAGWGTVGGPLEGGGGEWSGGENLGVCVTGLQRRMRWMWVIKYHVCVVLFFYVYFMHLIRSFRFTLHT